MPSDTTEPASETERTTVLRQLEDWIELPMLVLSFAWLLLVLAELIWGDIRAFEIFGTAIWIVFIAEFALRLWIAPRKAEFLRNNVISVVALVAPAFRVLRVLRFARAIGAARGCVSCGLSAR
jgi:voltage-gated potassium channel